MKSQALADAIGILACIALLIFFFTVIFPKILDTLVSQLVYSSGGFVARDFAALLTLTRATERAELRYPLHPQITYDVRVKDRILQVTPYYKAPYAEKTSGFEYLGVETGNVELEKVEKGISVSYEAGDFRFKAGK